MDLLVPLPRSLAELQERAEELKPEEELKGSERRSSRMSEEDILKPYQPRFIKGLENVL